MKSPKRFWILNLKNQRAKNVVYKRKELTLDREYPKTTEGHYHVGRDFLCGACKRIIEIRQRVCNFHVPEFCVACGTHGALSFVRALTQDFVKRHKWKDENGDFK